MKIKTYEVLKQYPGGPPVGHTLIPKTIGTKFIGYYWRGTKIEPEDFPEFFKNKHNIPWINYIQRKYRIHKSYNPFFN